MRNHAAWQPSKYVYTHGALAASRDQREVGLGSRLMVDLIAGVYDRQLRHHATGRLLDLGCGKVPLYAAYRDLVTDNVCVDWPNTLHRNTYLDHELDLTHPLPFVAGSFDTIILSDVLEHIPEPMHLWREMTRVLAPGGKILMNVPFYYWLHEEPHDYFRYTEHALRRFVACMELDLLHLESLGGAPEIVTDIFAKNVLELPVAGEPLAVLAQWFTGAVLRTRLGRKVSNRTSAGFPFGYFLVAQKPI